MMSDVERAFIRKLQEQWGSLWHAAEAYIEGRMPREQMYRLENAAPGFIEIVSRQRQDALLAGLLRAHEERIAALEAATR